MADLDIARIKRNVAKMAAQNAPEADIDGYIASEGTTVDAVRAFRPSTPAPQVGAAPTASGQTPQDTGGSFIDNTVRAVGRGVLGIGSYLDEMDAATNATLAPVIDPLLPDSYQKLPGATWSERYDQALGIQRGKDKKFDEEHPYVSTGAQVAGGIGSAVGVIRAAPAVGNVVLGNGGAGVGARLAAGIGSGVGVGAVHGFGAGEGDVAQRGIEAGKGAAIGAVAGAVALPVGAAIGKGLNAASDVIAARGGEFGRTAQDRISRALANEGLTLDEAVQRVRQMGPDAMLADASTGLRYEAEQIAHTDRAGRAGVINSISDRAKAAGGRITSAYDDVLGPRPNVQQTLADMSSKAKTNADYLYGEARRQNLPVDVNPVIQAIDGQLLTPSDRIAGPSGLPADAVDNALSWVRSHLTDGQSQRTGIDHLDRLERRVRAQTKSAFEGGRSDVGHALNEVGKVLRGQMKASSPIYKRARETFSDDMGVQDAFKAGQELFAKKTHPDFLAAEIADMSQAEREALKLGVRSA